MAEEMRPRLAIAWMTYAERVLPEHAPQVQKQETRRAFYAGAYAALQALLQGVSDSDEETPEDEALIPALEAEIAQHVTDVLAGRA